MSGQVKVVLDFVIAHWGEIMILASLAVTILKLTSWGKAKSKALDEVSTVIEGAKAIDVKEMLRVKEPTLDPSVFAAIVHTVNKVDPKKTPEPVTGRFVRELLRGIINIDLPKKEGDE